MTTVNTSLTSLQCETKVERLRLNSRTLEISLKISRIICYSQRVLIYIYVIFVHLRKTAIVAKERSHIRAEFFSRWLNGVQFILAEPR